MRKYRFTESCRQHSQAILPALVLPQPGVTPCAVQRCRAAVLPYRAAQKLLRAPLNSVYIPALQAHPVQTAEYQQHKPPTILVREIRNRTFSYMTARLQASSSA